jgi:hypothetical protein
MCIRDRSRPRSRKSIRFSIRYLCGLGFPGSVACPRRDELKLNPALGVSPQRRPARRESKLINELSRGVFTSRAKPPFGGLPVFYPGLYPARSGALRYNCVAWAQAVIFPPSRPEIAARPPAHAKPDDPESLANNVHSRPHRPCTSTQSNVSSAFLCLGTHPAPYPPRPRPILRHPPHSVFALKTPTPPWPWL